MSIINNHEFYPLDTAFKNKHKTNVNNKEDIIEAEIVDKKDEL